MVINLIQNLGFTSIAIASSVFGAIAAILARTLLKNLRTQDILGINFLTMGATLVLLSPLFYRFNANLKTMSVLVLIAIIDTAANYFFFKTFEKVEASVAVPILSLAPAFTFILSYLFLDDKVGLKTLFFAIAIIVVIIVFSLDFKDTSKFNRATLFPAICSSALFGISAIPSKYLLSTLNVINAPTLYMFRAGFIALFALLVFNFTVNHITIHQYRIIFLRSLFVIAQWLLLYLALVRGSAGVAVTLGNITPVFVFILSIIFLREKISFKKMICAALILGLSFLI